MQAGLTAGKGLRAARNARRAAWSALFVLGLGLAATPLAAQAERVPSLLLGGAAALGSERPTISVDPRLPRGAARVSLPRPASAHVWCAPRAPVCVHTAADEPQRAWAALTALQTAFVRLTTLLGLPAPLLDGQRGGGPELDLYLQAPRAESSWQLSAGWAPQDEVLMDAAWLRQDSASAFCVNSAPQVSLAAATRCVAGALAARLDAAETPALRAAYASSLSDWVVGAWETGDAEARDWVASDAKAGDRWTDAGAAELALQVATELWQRNPQLSVTGREASNLTPAGRAWFTFLDAHLAAGERGVLPTALFSLSRSLTRDPHPEWNNEPDVFDVLYSSLGNDARKFANLVLRHALERALWGQGAAVNGLTQVEYDWQLTYSSLPRRVAGSRALEPLGCSVSRLALDGVQLGARLAMVAEWEAPAPMIWGVLAVDAQGNEQNRWELPYLEKGQRVEHTLLNFEAAAALVLVGCNLGSVDLQHPYDPDQEPWEPHAFTLYLTELP